MTPLVRALRKPPVRLCDLEREPMVSATVATDVPRVFGYADYRAWFAPLACEEAAQAYPEHMAANRAAYARQAAAAHAQNACLRPHHAAALAVGFVARRCGEITLDATCWKDAAE